MADHRLLLCWLGCLLVTSHANYCQLHILYSATSMSGSRSQPIPCNKVKIVYRYKSNYLFSKKEIINCDPRWSPGNLILVDVDIWHMTTFCSKQLVVVIKDVLPSAGAFSVLLRRLFSSCNLDTAVTNSADSVLHCSSIASISYHIKFNFVQLSL